MANGRYFRTPVISSWKYAGACASPKGTLTYSYLPNSDVNAVLGIESEVSPYGGIQLSSPRWRSILHH